MYSFEADVAGNGLPAAEQSLFATFGLDSALQQEVTGITFVQDINAVSALVATTDSTNLLENQQFNTDIVAAGNSFQQFAIANGYSPIECTKAAPTVTALWPPNHKFVAVGIEGIVDEGGLPFTTTITSIQQDEPLDIDGSGHTEIDGVGVGSSVVNLRAERSGGGSGRLYFINFMATDTSQATCSGSVTVMVPHDPNHPAIDTDLRYNSNGSSG